MTKMSWFDRCIPNGSVYAENLVCSGTKCMSNLPQYQPKSVWPEMVGNHYLEAQQIVQREAPWVQINLVPYGTPFTDDFRKDRVRIFYDQMGKVVIPPRKG